jgi:hypothetical protein
MTAPKIALAIFMMIVAVAGHVKFSPLTQSFNHQVELL